MTQFADAPDATLIDMLRLRAAEAPDRLSHGFLGDAGAEGRVKLSYAELDEEARRIAAALQKDHAPGARALLLLPPGLPFLTAFFGALYAGLIPIPAPAPEFSRRKRTLPRLQSIVTDADVSVVVSAGETLELLEKIRGDVPELAAIPLVDTRAAPAEGAEGWTDPGRTAGDLAYFQYSSGSTGKPKGVALTHGQVMGHCRILRASAGYGPDSKTVVWMPHFHDYGLVEGLLLPMQNGTPSYVMSPFAFLKRPFAWLDAMGKLKATHSQAPNFAYDQCVRRIKPEQRAKLDLSSVVAFGNAAEPINPETTARFVEAFAPAGLRPGAMCPAYGLAEATLIVSHSDPASPWKAADFDAAALAERRAEPAREGVQARRIVSCGRPVVETDIRIVDPDSFEQQPEGALGEIWVSAPGVASGYWERPDATAESFGGIIAGSGDGPYLRTGDMGFLLDGELFVGSRLKDLIIIAGANHAPQDVEWTVESASDAVRPGHVAAAGVVVDGDEKLVVAAEVERGALKTEEDYEALVSAIRRAVAEGHEVMVHAVAIIARAGLPKTASGKIQRHVCESFLAGGHPDVLALWATGRGLRISEPA